MITTRFAPSPTGFLHVGNLRTAVMNWVLARQKPDGTFILRIDDTDAGRSEQRFADAIRRDLEWLGLTWNREVIEPLARLVELAKGPGGPGDPTQRWLTQDEMDSVWNRMRAC